MLEQELKPGARQGRTLRERERKRVRRNRILSAGVVLSLSAALIVVVKRSLPQWLEMPGNPSVNTAQAKPISYTSAGTSLLPPDAAMQGNTPNSSRLQKSVAKSAPKTQPIRHVLLPAGLGPELLPADETDVPRRRRRRHALPKPSAQKPASQKPADAAPPKHAESDAPKPVDPAPAQPISKPPDDVPDNP